MATRNEGHTIGSPVQARGLEVDLIKQTLHRVVLSSNDFFTSGAGDAVAQRRIPG